MTNIEMLEKLIKESGCVELWDHNTDDFIKPDPVRASRDDTYKGMVLDADSGVPGEGNRRT